MALICDTGAIYALYDADDQHHAECQAVVSEEQGPLFLPSALLSEIDYLLATRLGFEAALDFIDSIQTGAFTLVGLTAEDLVRCRELVSQYRDLPLGLADACVVAVAERLRLQTLFTVDQRHFRTVQPHGFGHFVLLPADRVSS
jgi:predicted nucleic acid-binding protein